jgi:hypothetical protein
MFYGSILGKITSRSKVKPKVLAGFADVVKQCPISGSGTPRPSALSKNDPFVLRN